MAVNQLLTAKLCLNMFHFYWKGIKFYICKNYVITTVCGYTSGYTQNTIKIISKIINI